MLFAFESGFELLIGIMESEGWLEGSVVIQDCLRLMVLILENNTNTQCFFREMGFCHKVPFQKRIIFESLEFSFFNSKILKKKRSNFGTSCYAFAAFPKWVGVGQSSRTHCRHFARPRLVFRLSVVARQSHYQHAGCACLTAYFELIYCFRTHSRALDSSSTSFHWFFPKTVPTL